MSSNVFGQYFKIMTFGESHGPCLGVVIDGVPPQFSLDLEAIQHQLDLRKPGQSIYATQRTESDTVRIVSGLFQGLTTGTPLCMLIQNQDCLSHDYESHADLFRPGHADYTYFKKYKIRDWRGGGRSSGRETVARVAAGAVARQILMKKGITIWGQVTEIAGITSTEHDTVFSQQNPLRCGDRTVISKMETAIKEAQAAGDSVGGIVEIRVQGVPAGWGDPIFGKLDALLAYALMSIGSVKGVEIGDGFSMSRMLGSQSNDALVPEGFATNHSGGILGGISTGSEIVVRIAVKPTPSIAKEQQTITITGEPSTIAIKGRHDPCIAPRLVPVAEAMTALVLQDAAMAWQALKSDFNEYS